MTDKTIQTGAFAMPICFLVSVLEGYDLQVISSAGPALQKIMKLSQEQIGFFLSATLIGLAIGAVAGGWLADRIGRKPVVIVSVATLGVFTFATALSSTYEMVVITRILAGIGLGGAMPTLIATMTELTAAEKTTSAVTTMIVGQPLGGIISGLAGRTMVTNFGWQSLFLVGGVLTVLTLPLLIRYLPETRRPGTANMSVRMPAIQALFGEGRAAATLLLWTSFILTLALLSILLGWTPLLVKSMGYPIPVGINAIIAINVGGIVGGLIASRAIDKLGVRVPMLVLYGVMALGLYMFASVETPTGLMAAAFLVGLGVLGGQFTLYGVAPRVYPFQGRGSGVGFAVAMGRFGSVFAPIIVGLALGQGAGAGQSIQAMVPVALLAGLALLALTVVSSSTLGPAGRAGPVGH